MIRVFQVALSAAFSIALLVSPAAAKSVSDACPAQLRVADSGIDGLGNLKEAFGPFATMFKKLTGVELVLYPLSNRTAAGTALQFNEVDLVLAGPAEYVLFRRLTDVDILFSIVRPKYGSIIVTKANSGIKTLSDLKGKRVALKEPGSTSGHIFPLMLIAEAGLDPKRDIKIIMAGHARIQALINGDVDALGTGKKDWDALRKQDPNTEYRLLAQTDTLPGDPFLARASLPQDCRDALRTALREHADALWKSLTSTKHYAKLYLKRGAYMSFDTDPAAYGVVERAYEIAGIPLDN